MDNGVASADPVDLDPDRLRERYRVERARRVRPDGNDQFVEVTGAFSKYLIDPYVEPIYREPLRDAVDVVIIGGGFGGLLAAAHLRQAGVADIRMIEKGGDFGGTWYWNRYPGAMCDIESYIYLPLLDELGYVPTEKYTQAPEILDHARAIGEFYELYDNACLQTEVTEMEWDDDDQRWVISTNRDDRIRARFVCMANGLFNRPKLPGIPGIEEFRGHTFHTSRWDYEYTGGSTAGELTGLSDKRVGIIGTGATAVQCVPHLGASAEHLYVFQRTPSSIDVRANRPTDPEWAAGLQPGWQRARMQNFNNLLSGLPESEDLVSDGWTDIWTRLRVNVRRDQEGDSTGLDAAKAMEMADFAKMETVRARVDSIVNDPATAEALKPYYRQFCKRPCFHDEYLDTFNRPNVTLVDTKGKGVERITPAGVVVDGVEYELDCIIFATGFEFGTEYTRRAGYDPVGRGGQRLSEKWADGMETLHGIHAHGFPNCFIFQTIQSAITPNFPHLLDELSRHMAYVLGYAFEHDIAVVEVSAEAEAAWARTIVDHAQWNLEFLESCTPSYLNNEGHPAKRSLQNMPYGGGAVEFFQILADWRTDGTLPGLDLTTVDDEPG